MVSVALFGVSSGLSTCNSNNAPVIIKHQRGNAKMGDLILTEKPNKNVFIKCTKHPGC